jgi:hypothetical protein
VVLLARFSAQRCSVLEKIDWVFDVGSKNVIKVFEETVKR